MYEPYVSIQAEDYILRQMSAWLECHLSHTIFCNEYSNVLLFDIYEEGATK